MAGVGFDIQGEYGRQAGIAGMSSAYSHGNAAYMAPVVVNPPLNVANEIVGMLGSYENGGRFEAYPSSLASFLNGGGEGSFNVELGSVSGRAGASTVAIAGLALALAVGWLLFGRKRG